MSDKYAHKINTIASKKMMDSAGVQYNSIIIKQLPSCSESDDHFMETASLIAKSSKDPVTQVGACVVNEGKQIVGTGYNHMPKGLDQMFTWKKKYWLDNKHLYVCHAELNAIMNKKSFDVKNCTIYVTLFPCNECAKVIIQSGIKKVIYMSDKHAHQISTIASKKMLEIAGVEYKQFVSRV